MYRGAACGPGARALEVRDQLAPPRAGREEPRIEEIRPFPGRLCEAGLHSFELSIRQRDLCHQPGEEPRQLHRRGVLRRQRVESVEAVPEILLEENPGLGSAAAQGRRAQLRFQRRAQSAPAARPYNNAEICATTTSSRSSIEVAFKVNFREQRSRPADIGTLSNSSLDRRG